MTSESARKAPRRRITVVLGLVVVALAALLGLVIQSERAATDVARTAEASLEERGRELAAVKRELDAQAGTLERLERENGELVEVKTQLSLDVAAKEEELAKLKTTYVQLEERMANEIKSGDIKLTQIGGRLQVDLVDKVLFESGESTISRRGEEVLARVGAVLATIDDKQVQVSGHTDDSPPTAKIADRFPTNWELSTARATNVVRFLEDKAKIPGKRLVASGHGQYRPVAANATATGRARNRRIEILLIPVIEPVPASKRKSR